MAARDLLRRLAGAGRGLRQRVGWLDHLIRAGIRYDEADGGRLSAAVTYYAFFAVFALGLLGVAIFGFVLDNASILHSVQNYAAQELPGLNVLTLRDARGTIGVIAFFGLPVTGWFWVDSLRSSIRRMWRLPEYPGNFFVRILIDLLVLAGLGVLLVVSLGLAYATTRAAGRLVHAADPGSGLSAWLLDATSHVLGIAVNTILACGALTGLPRVRMAWRRLLGPALLVATGLELLKTIGRVYIRLTESNPTYQLVAGSVGLLVFLNAINQLFLFAAALTATGTSGNPADLAGRNDDNPTPEPDGQGGDKPSSNAERPGSRSPS